MRLTKILICGLPLCLGAISMGSASVAARADAPAPQALAEDAGAVTRRVEILNMSAPLMAFLLEPKGQPEPLLLSTSRENSRLLAHPTEHQIPAGFEIPALPRGVAIVKVDDAHNSLILRGSAEAVDAWEKAIRALDKPLTQVEIEMQMMSLPPEALKQLRVPTDSPGPHLIEANYTQALRAFLANGQAKVLTAPRVTAIAGLTASLTSTQSTPVAVPELPTPLYMNQATGMTVRPTVRPDGDIDMELEAGRSLWVAIKDEAPVPVRRAQSFSFRAQDGRSYLFYARPSLAAPAPNDAPISGAMPDAKGDVCVYIVSARIIRRVPIKDAPVAK